MQPEAMAEAPNPDRERAGASKPQPGPVEAHERAGAQVEFRRAARVAAPMLAVGRAVARQEVARADPETADPAAPVAARPAVRAERRR